MTAVRLRSFARWAAQVVLVAAPLLVFAPSTAYAHAGFLGSDPVDGSVLAVAPQQVEFHFSEGVLDSASRVTLTVIGSGATTDLDLTSGDEGRSLIADLPELGRGSYLLTFVAIDPADLHRTVGGVAFGVGLAPPPVGDSIELGSSIVATGVRALADAGIVVSVGAGVLVLLFVRRRLDVPVTASRCVVVTAAIAGAAWLVSLVLELSATGIGVTRWPSLLLASSPGRRAVVGVELVLGMWWVARWMATLRAGARQVAAVLQLAIGFGFVVVASIGGHSGVGGSAPIGTLVRVLHLASIACWLGLVVVSWWTIRRTALPAAVWRDVSMWATVGLAVTGGSGLILTSRVVSTVTALLSTGYGRVVVAKVVLLCVGAVIGLGAARAVRSGHAPRRLAGEMCLAVAAVVAAAWLTGASPALGARFEPAVPASPQLATGDTDDLTVSLRVVPARPGPNLVRVSVLDTRKPSPGVVEGVELVIRRGDGEVVASRPGELTAGSVEWADVEIAGPGDYSVAVVVDRPMAPVAPFGSTISIAPLPPSRAPTVVSDARLASFTPWVGLAWLVAVGLGAALVRRR